MFKQRPSPYETAGNGILDNEPSQRRSSLFGTSSVSSDAPPRIFEQRSEPEPLPEPTPPSPPPRAAEPQQFDLPLEQPETTLGQGVVFKGTLNFARLLRIDGTFEGELVSEGKLIVGPSGVVKSNIRLREAIIEGHVIGNITATERVELRGHAHVEGDIEARSLSVDEGVSLIGVVAVKPEG